MKRKKKKVKKVFDSHSMLMRSVIREVEKKKGGKISAGTLRLLEIMHGNFENEINYL
jgi:hypothetical protein